MSLMATELANEVQQFAVRQLAGVVLKNCVHATSTEAAQQKAAAWLAIDANARGQVKQTVLGCLASPQKEARKQAASVVAAIGVIELTHNQWAELIQGLVNNVTTSGSDPLKESSLEALGYICEEIDTATLAPQSNLILTAVVQGMRKEEPNPDVRLAGTRALLNALGASQPRTRPLARCALARCTPYRARAAAPCRRSRQSRLGRRWRRAHVRRAQNSSSPILRRRASATTSCRLCARGPRLSARKSR